MPRKHPKPALVYYRANSTIGGHPDNLPGQQKLVKAFTKKNRIKIVGEYLDTVRLGQGFDQLQRELERTGVKLVIVSEASIISPNPIDREILITLMKRELDIHVVTCAGLDMTAATCRATEARAA